MIEEQMMAGYPSMEGLRERYDEMDREMYWWADHQAEFVRLYPDQFVAVRDGEVVAVTSDLSALVDELKSQGLSITEVWVSFIDPDPSMLIL